MLRKSMVLGASALLLASLVPAVSTASAATLSSLATTTQPKDDDRYVNLDTQDRNNPLYDPKSFKSVAPNVVTTVGGKRVEIYGSVGNNEGGMDWRTVNAFAYLVNSVPKNSKSYATLFNSLYDNRSISRNSTTNKWEAATSNEVFSPTAAYLNQVNLYDNEAERKEYIHVLGAKESMDEAYAANSSLAKLVMSGYHNRPGAQAVNYEQCVGDGGCLSGPNHLMHSKYAAFEKAADSTGQIRDNVVWMTSSNLNGSSGSKKSNISIAIFDDAKAFKAIKEGIFDISAEVAKGNVNWWNAPTLTPYKEAIQVDPATGVIRGMPTDSGITLIPSPRAQYDAASSANLPKTDVEAAFLKKQADTNVVKNNTCKVYAVHSLFNSTRDGVKHGLNRLHQQGCDVRIVLGENALSDLVDGYFNMSEDLREVIGRVEFANVHDKTLSYKYGSTTTTFGGASNFTGPGLEYDELAWRADNAAVTAAVQEHSERIYGLAKGQTTWATPTKLLLYPSSSSTKRIKLAKDKSVTVATRVSPRNALVTNTTWVSSNPAVAEVSAGGVVTGKSPGAATITVKVIGPQTKGKTPHVETKQAFVTVGAAGTATDSGVGGRANLPPTLTMDNYQSPGGLTDITVTWGSGEDSYDGVVKLQYYSGGWKTYGTHIKVKDGVGQLSKSFGGSHTWRAYGARLDKVSGEDPALPNSTAKAKSKWSYSTVRTRSASSKPRLYATNLAKVGKVPLLLQRNGGGKLRLQMRSSGGSWKTHKTYYVSGDQEFVVMPMKNTKYWRIASSSGVSNTIRISMR